MKKILLSLCMLLSALASFGQSALELAKQQQELEAFNKKMLNAKPTKAAKQQAKELKKEGWTVPAGEPSIEQQITKSQLYREELMAMDDGSATKRYFMHTAIHTSGTYNVGYAAARTNALTEVASMIKTQLVSSIKSKIDNSQTSSINATSVEKFSQKIDAIVDETLTNGTPMLAIYRRLQNGSMEVQVSFAFDKKDIMARMKKNMQKELEKEGEEMFKVAQDVINNQM